MAIRWMQGQGTGSRGERVVTTPVTLPPTAEATEVYNARLGRARTVPSFSDSLAVQLSRFSRNVRERASLQQQAEVLFVQVTTKEYPLLRDIVVTAKRLGIQHDLVLPRTMDNIAYALKTDLWGERPQTDYPETLDTPRAYYDQTANRVSVHPGSHRVSISTLNHRLDTQELTAQLQTYQHYLDLATGDPLLQSQPELREFVVRQAISRRVLAEKEQLQAKPFNLEGARFIHAIGEGNAKQVSNGVEIWELKDGKRVIVKTGPYHTLQAEKLEQALMREAGMPVPQTELREFNGTERLIVEFLEGYTEENDPFVLSSEYHANRQLQRGLVYDLWLAQYNRRPHNVMMKGQKVAFIDHGGALFCRATGGFKGLGAEITTENLWDILRTIPDSNPNGDESVNAAYANILTIEGGSKGRIVIKNPAILLAELSRLSRFTNEQIETAVTASGFISSAEQLADWGDKVNQTLSNLRTIGETPSQVKGDQKAFAVKKGYIDRHGQLTDRYVRDVRWAEEALHTFAAADQAGGMKNYLVQTLVQRRDNLVALLTPMARQQLEAMQTIRREAGR